MTERPVTDSGTTGTRSGGASAGPPHDAAPASGDVWLSDAPLELGALIARVARPKAGGICAFLGVVREENLGRMVDHLVYEAFPGMAEAEMRAIAAEAAERWPGARVAMAHRTGRLAIGEASVAVAASAPHRAEAFAACRHAIDALKARVPIWKKEVWEDGSAWVEGAAPSPLEGGT